MSTQDRRPGKSRRLADIGILYFSKSGAVVVNLLVLPRLQILLSPQDFGLVALFVTLQALLLVLDLGLSALVGRDVAISPPSSSQPFLVWRTAEAALSLGYLIGALVVLVAAASGAMPLDPGMALFAIGALWLLTLQNIGYSALLARQDFMVGSSLLVAGSVLRGIASLLAVMAAPTLLAFLLAQAGFALLQFLVIHMRCRSQLGGAGAVGPSPSRSLAAIGALLWRARSLSLFGIAGAIVLQADKLILSVLTSPAEMSPYFLATSLCLLPISILAGPLASFFQPRVLQAFGQQDTGMASLHLRRLAHALIAVVLLPTALVWLLRGPLIDTWLLGAENVALVVRYTAILLPGVCLGAFGFLPYMALLGRGDFVFQARLSIGMTAVTLGAATLAAARHDVLLVCWIYALYHAASTLLSWLRWNHLERADNSRLALITATPILVSVALTGGSVWFLSTVI